MNQKQNDIITNCIELMRVPLLLGVILIHCQNLYPEPQYQADYPNLIRWIFVFIINYAESVCVPAFFVISGYLFFFNVSEFNSDCYRKKLMRRVRSLLIPYILWTLIRFLYLSANGLFANASPSFSEMLTLNIFWNFDSLGMPLLSQLWYVRNLMVIVIFTPVLFQMTRRMPTALSALLIFGALFIWSPLSPIWNTMILALFFFTAGAVLSLHSDKLGPFLSKTRHAVLGLCLAVLYLCHLGILPLECFTILGTWSCFIIFHFISRKSSFHFNSLLTGSSFFVYCLHTFAFITLTETLLRSIIPDDAAPILMLVRLLAAPCIIYFICSMIFLILQRLCPKILSLLSGNRGVNNSK